MSYARTAVTRMTLDMSRLDLQRSETVTLGDTNRRWEVTLTNGGTPFRLPPNWTAALTGIKPDGTGLLNGCSVADGKIIYDFAAGKEIATCAGSYPVQFDIWDEVGDLVASPKVYVNVLADVRPHAELESDGQYTLIGETLTRVAEAEKDINENAEEISATKKKVEENQKQIEKLAPYRPYAVITTIPTTAWEQASKDKPYTATFGEVGNHQHVTIWGLDNVTIEWLNVNRPTVSIINDEICLTAAAKPSKDLTLAMLTEPYSVGEEGDEGDEGDEAYSLAELVGLTDEAVRLNLGKRMTSAETRLDSAEVIGGLVEIKASDWVDYGTTINLPIEADTLTLLWPGDEASRTIAEKQGIHINQAFVNDDEDEVLLIRVVKEDYNGALRLRYIRLPMINAESQLAAVLLIGAKNSQNVGSGGGNGDVVIRPDPHVVLTIAADSWSETTPIGRTTWLTGAIPLEDITPTTMIRLSAMDDDTAIYWSVGQTGAAITYDEETETYSLRVWIIGDKPAVDWQILVETATVEETEGVTGPWVSVIPPVTDATYKVDVHNYDKEAHPNLLASLSDLSKGLAATNKAVELRLKSEDLPTKLDEYRTAKGLIDKTVSDLVNYYTKSQTLTKDEINALVSAIPKFKIEVVTSLPASNISETTVYLVKSGNDDSNLYTEYIYANSKWEKLGTQTVDLTGYATEAWVDDLIAAYVKTADMEAYVAGLLKAYITKDVADETYQPAGDYPTSDEMNEAISEATKDLAPKTSIPTKTSQLNNDSGFITQHQSLAHLLPRYQGAENAGKYMIVGADGYITLVDAPETGDVIGVIGEDRQIALSGDIAKGTYELLWTDDKGNTYKAGSLTVGEMYTVTANVTNCTVVSNTDRVLEGRPYTATVTPDSGHEITSITVTMGSDDITGEAVNGEEISIASVTGDITITAVATEKAETYTILSYAEVGAETGEVDTGYVATAKTGFSISFAATITGTVSGARYNNGFCGNKAFCIGMVTDNARAFKGSVKSFELFKDSDTADHIVKLNYNGDGACEIDGANKNWNTNGAAPTDFTESLRIFTAGSHGTLSKGALYLRVYEFTVTENGSVVRTLKPCKRGKDGNIGFYDTVNGVFYPSTGAVMGGAVVEEISL